MKYIAILSQSESESNTLLCEALKLVGIEADIFYLDEKTEFDSDGGMLIDTVTKTQYPLTKYSAIYGRTWDDLSACHKMEEWVTIMSEKFNVTSLDSIDGIHLNNNKYKMMSVFTDNNIDMPNTLTIADLSVDEAVKQCLAAFSEMVVLKRDGSGGKNIEFIPLDYNGALLKDRLARTYPDGKVNETLVLQQYVESKDEARLSYHYRVIVVDDVLVMGMRFTAKTPYILCSNIALGGTAKAIDLDDIFTLAQKEQIRKSCKVTGVNVAGVDIIFSPQKEMYILEVNNCPGLATAVKQCNRHDHLELIAAYCQKIVNEQHEHSLSSSSLKRPSLS